MTVTAKDIRRIVNEIYPVIRALRRDLHRHPETAYEEVRTAKKVSGHLKKLKIPHRTKVGRTGVVGVIRGKRGGKCIALRADMDALAMQEKNRFAHRSVIAGRMHACGHDGHTANLVGVAHVLSRLRRHIKGSVKLLFQPAEEGGAGAAAMLKDGAFRNPRPDGDRDCAGQGRVPGGSDVCRDHERGRGLSRPWGARRLPAQGHRPYRDGRRVPSDGADGRQPTR